MRRDPSKENVQFFGHEKTVTWMDVFVDPLFIYLVQHHIGTHNA